MHFFPNAVNWTYCICLAMSANRLLMICVTGEAWRLVVNGLCVQDGLTSLDKSPTALKAFCPLLQTTRGSSLCHHWSLPGPQTVSQPQRRSGQWHALILSQNALLPVWRRKMWSLPLLGPGVLTCLPRFGLRCCKSWLQSCLPFKAHLVNSAVVCSEVERAVLGGTV